MNIFFWIDALLIAPFRWVATPELGFFLGIFFLACYSVILGWLSSLGVQRLQRSVVSKHSQEARKRSELAMQALELQDKNAYLAQNRLAKDAYGKTMGVSVARITSSLWTPVAALAWLDLRFRGIPLPLPVAIPGLGNTVFYPFYFILLYFILRILYGRLIRHAPFYPRLMNWVGRSSQTIIPDNVPGHQASDQNKANPKNIA